MAQEVEWSRKSRESTQASARERKSEQSRVEGKDWV